MMMMMVLREASVCAKLREDYVSEVMKGCV